MVNLFTPVNFRQPLFFYVLKGIKRNRWPEIINFLRINLRASNTPYLIYLEEEKKKKDFVKVFKKVASVESNK